MKKLFILVILMALAFNSKTQTLYAPGGTIGNNITNTNVGIGTSTPSEKLYVLGNLTLEGVNSTLKFVSSNSLYSRAFKFYLNNTDLSLIFSDISDYSLVTYNAGGTNFTAPVLQLGKYAVTYNPELKVLGRGTQTLRLADISDKYGFDIVNRAASARLDIIRHANNLTGVAAMSIMRDNGNVGIGTITPLQLFNVHGVTFP